VEQIATIERSNAAGSTQPQMWHIVTCEYPPLPGGVSGHTHSLAGGLASSGDEVHVWCPRLSGPSPEVLGVEVHALLGSFSLGDLRRTGRELNQFPRPRRLFVQWVPHGYGRKGVNLFFCLWLWFRSAFRRDRVEVMVHEPFLGFNRVSWRQSAAAIIQRFMMAVLLRAATRVWLSTPTWERFLRAWDRRGRVYRWLPIPSNVPVSSDASAVSEVRRKYGPQGLLLGHFGTFGSSITEILRVIVPPILNQSAGASLLFIGMGSSAFRRQLIEENPCLGERIHATEYIPNEENLSAYISACDLFLQPYPDGVTSRRTTIMAALVHGRAVVTTSGPLTEPFWNSSGAAEITPAGQHEIFVEAALRLLANPQRRIVYGKAALALYRREFDVDRMVGRLKDAT
jgi:glycosyltransferase involved in cell wall biosynthesis